MIYVDEIIKYPNAKAPFKNGSCHLFSDNLDDNTELIDFGEEIGLKFKWIHLGTCPHFDLTPWMRKQAIQKGAKEVTISEMVKIYKDHMRSKK
jgi:hypothetical protein